MKIEFVDVLKLAVPFFTAIFMVWIKGWIENHLSRKAKQHALSRLLDDEIRSASASVQVFKRIAESAVSGKLELVSLDPSNLVSKFACDLADLDPKNAYLYAELAARLELVNKGLTCLSALTLSRAAASTNEIKQQLDGVIIGQSKNIARDLVSMDKAALAVIKVIPEKHRYSNDPQAIRASEQSICLAENELNAWLKMGAKQGVQADPPAADGDPSA